MITPSIGRVLWIHNRAGSLDLSQPEAALLCFVHGDRGVNVGGFDANGTPFGLCSVPLLQDDDTAPRFGPYATWMPYQKAQAEKQNV